MKYIIRQITFAALFLLVVAGCDESAFVKTIDIEQADFPPKLAVTATLDADSGRFTLMIREAHSTGYYKTFNSDQQTIVRDGTVRLFEDEKEIFSMAEAFDLSVSNYGKNGYYAMFTDISAVAGRTYRLEIDIEGYDKATATAVMPEAPVISIVSVDAEHPVKKENIMNIASLSNSSWSTTTSYYNYHVPFSLNITDNTSAPDFYSFQMESYIKTKYEGDAYEYEYTSMMNIETSNLALIQDNPDVESADIMMSGENVDLYSFDLMMLTDATFANTGTRLDLYYPQNGIASEMYEYDSQYHTSIKNTLTVRHHTQEAFKQYRSMAFQLAGLGFFSEPVFITSNMENAYGGFSVQNTVRIVLNEIQY